MLSQVERVVKEWIKTMEKVKAKMFLFLAFIDLKKFNVGVGRERAAQKTGRNHGPGDGARKLGRNQ